MASSNKKNGGFLVLSSFQNNVLPFADQCHIQEGVLKHSTMESPSNFEENTIFDEIDDKINQEDDPYLQEYGLLGPVPNAPQKPPRPNVKNKFNLKLPVNKCQSNQK